MIRIYFIVSVLYCQRFDGVLGMEKNLTDDLTKRLRVGDFVNLLLNKQLD